MIEFKETIHLAFRRLQEAAMRAEVESGFHLNTETGEAKPINVGEKIALMHSELSEALESDRTSSPSRHITGISGLEEELADCIIRILGFAEWLRFDLGATIMRKMEYNWTRQDHKFDNRTKVGGKRY